MPAGAKPNATSGHNHIDWKGFGEYLTNLNQRPHCIQNKIGSPRGHFHILETGNTQYLLKVSNGFRVHTMGSLSSLKFLGCYDAWMSIVKKYQIRWKNGDYQLTEHIQKHFRVGGDNNKQSLPNMIDWIGNHSGDAKRMPIF